MSTNESEREKRRSAAGTSGDRACTSEEGRDPHFEEQGHTAEDAEGVGYGEEGFHAEEYPGHNPLRGESERERRHRTAVTWTWPRVDPELRDTEEAGERSDLRICHGVARRILRTGARPIRLVVAVLDGEIALEGEVEALEDDHVIRGVAASVEGVTRVESRLVVRTEASETPSETPEPQ